MNKLSLNQGRVGQKLKTRTRILQAAKKLMRKKERITLEDIAESAEVSRATIYRYFSNVDILVTEASLDIHHTTPEDLSSDLEGLDLEDKILELQTHYNSLAQRHETSFRRYLSAVLNESIVSKRKIRGSRRIDALNLSLAEYRKVLNKEDFEHLINLLALLMGIDALLVTKDVCSLNNAQSDQMLKWAIKQILAGLKLRYKDL